MRTYVVLLAALLLSVVAPAKDRKRVSGQENAAGVVRTTEGGRTAVCITFYAPDIVRVVKYPAAPGGMPDKHSYSVVLRPDPETGRTVRQTEHADTLTLCSSRIKVELDLNSGRIRFFAAGGAPLLSERSALFEPLEGTRRFRVSQTWALSPDEYVFGLGQTNLPEMNHRRCRVELWNRKNYIPIPYFSSSRGYGLYWDNAGKSLYEDTEQGTTVSSEEAAMIDYYFLYGDGSQDSVLSAVRALSGQATMLPLWAMGFWQCRERYKTPDELCDALDRHRLQHIPVDAMVQDWRYWGCDSNWNAMLFQSPYFIDKVGDPDYARYVPEDMRDYPSVPLRIKSPEEMVSYVHGKHAHIVLSVWPSFGPWTDVYGEMEAINALIPIDQYPLGKGIRPYDVFNPRARDIYWKHLEPLLRMGFDGWWTDSTEPGAYMREEDEDLMTHDGVWRAVKNAYPLLANQGIYEHQRAAARGKGKAGGRTEKRAIQLTRSGTFGLQHCATFSWSGDIMASWSEMKRQIPSGLGYTLCGIPYWSTDLGGFFHHEYEQSPKNPALAELHARWLQWGVFQPVMRNHCSSPMVNEIYAFGSEGDWAYDAMVGAVRLRYRLLPYIYSLMGAVVQRSGTMMRPLVMDFTHDPKALSLNDTYMFGPALLVRPVTDPMFTWRDDDRRGHVIYPHVEEASAPVRVYLPAFLPEGEDETGLWYDFFTNETFRGGLSLLRPTSINDFPLYVRAGSILPFGPDVQYSGEKPWDDLEIRVYPGADGSFTLYEDGGDGYGYERGQFSTITFRWDDASRCLTVGAREGGFEGMLRKRQFRIVLADKVTTGAHLPSAVYVPVSYGGGEISIRL